MVWLCLIFFVWLGLVLFFLFVFGAESRIGASVLESDTLSLTCILSPKFPFLYDQSLEFSVVESENSQIYAFLP